MIKRSLQSLFVVLLAAALAMPTCKKDEDDYNKLDFVGTLVVAGGFSDNGNGTIVDNTTRLTWMKCASGQVWNSGLNNCAGTGQETTWGSKSMQFCEAIVDYSTTECINENAIDASINPIAKSGPAFAACANDRTGGAGGWRLPNRGELEAFTAKTDQKTMAFTFPQTPHDKYFWTASGVSDSDGSEAYGVSFAASTFGQTNTFHKANSNLYVRCVK